jgi:hypothetical protein
MTLYLGKKAVCPTKIVKKEVAKVKFGVSIDNLLGNVDANGKYVRAEPLGEVVFNGLTDASGDNFMYVFSGTHDGTIRFPDLKTISKNSVFSYAFYNSNDVFITYDALEEINANSTFEYACGRTTSTNASYIKFPSLKKAYGNYNFRSMDSSVYRTFVFDDAFPKLEEAGGGQAFHSWMSSSSVIMTCTSLKKIVGGPAASSATFYCGSVSGTVKEIHWKFPNVVDISSYIANKISNRTSIVHFAPANQAAIEACDGYSYLFGAHEIRFDLMTKIILSGVEYTRGLTVGDPSTYNTCQPWTRWESQSGQIVYTDGDIEPEAGTQVYSDFGKTQIGTVEGAQ